jgi:hypothetical protein
VVECDQGEQLPRIVAKLCHRALRDLHKRWTAGQAMRRAFGVLKAFTLALGEDGQWRFNIDFDAVKGVADSGDPEVDIVELLGEIGRAASEHGEGVLLLLLLLDEMQFLSRADLGLLSKAMHQISQEVLPVLIASAGPPQLPLMLKEDKLYAERLFTFRTIDSLSPLQASEGAHVPASRENVSYAPDALRYILEQSQGYPYFLQQWGEAVWNEARQPTAPRRSPHAWDSPSKPHPSVAMACSRRTHLQPSRHRARLHGPPVRDHHRADSPVRRRTEPRRGRPPRKS